MTIVKLSEVLIDPGFVTPSIVNSI